MTIPAGDFAATQPSSATAHWLENSLFAGVADGADASDRLRLSRGPLKSGTTSRVRLRHIGKGRDLYSGVRLVAVDHQAGVEAFSTPAGEVLGIRGSVAWLHDLGGFDVLDRVHSAEGLSVQPGDVYELNLTPADVAGGALWIDTSDLPADDGGIRIEEDTPQGWRELALHTPRAESDVQVLTNVTSDHLRLVVLGMHHLRGIGRFVPASAPVRTEFAPQQVVVGATPLLDASQPFALASGDSAYAEFAAAQDPAGVVREWFLEVAGRPEGYQPTAAAMRAKPLPNAEAAPRGHFRLAGGMPNPFVRSTQVLFDLPQAAQVRVEIFDLLGRRIRTMQQSFSAGIHTISWDRLTESGSFAPRGQYTVRLTAGRNRASVRLTAM